MKKIHELQDWPQCLAGIRSLLEYHSFEDAVEENGGDALAAMGECSNGLDDLIAEGMLHVVVSLPPDQAALQLDQFAADIGRIRPGLEVAPSGDEEKAEGYRDLVELFAETQAGLPAVVAMFRAYAEGRCDTRTEGTELLEQIEQVFPRDEKAALDLVGRLGCLFLRGLEDWDFWEDMPVENAAVGDWLSSLRDVMESIEGFLEDSPLGEVELARDQWQHPGDEERIEYKRDKLARLGVAQPDLQELLLPLLNPEDEHPSPSEWKAIVEAGPRVVPGLIAIVGDEDSQLQSSISGGEAPIRAVELLGEMHAAEAVPALLEILQTAEWDTIIHDRALVVLEENLPDLAFDQARELFDKTNDVELRRDLIGTIAKGGRGKPGVFERLIRMFRQDRDYREMIAGYLADLGDPRALTELHDAFTAATTKTQRAEFAEAITRLGGELTIREQRLLERDRPQPQKPPANPPNQGPIHVVKVGRNDPCPCGSGKKYKKCCLP